ncbi:MAG: methylamine utilization protein MauE [Proteobacteria bacterium]|nr:methylamine utilization protein MauE [Pseudomonadota bacterium]
MFEPGSVDPSLALAGRILGALVFGWAVVGKLRHYDEFVGVVANYRLLPALATVPASWAVIGTEIYVCLGLLTPWFVASAATCALVLLAVFMLAMGVNLARGRREIDCGCFQSALRQQLSPALIVRNLVLMVLLMPAFLAATAATVPEGSALQLVDGIAAGLVGFVLYQALGQVLALGAGSRAARRS